MSQEWDRPTKFHGDGHSHGTDAASAAAVTQLEEPLRESNEEAVPPASPTAPATAQLIELLIREGCDLQQRGTRAQAQGGDHGIPGLRHLRHRQGIAAIAQLDQLFVREAVQDIGVCHDAEHSAERTQSV